MSATTLADQIRACTRCPLHTKQDNHKQSGKPCLPVPPYVGTHYARGGIAVVCEAPGYYEAQDGEPLVGRAGKLFDVLAAKAGLPRDHLLLTNSVRCRPPNNRIADYPEAVVACAAWTDLEFQVYDPRVVVLMGRVAIRSVFGADASVSRIRGSFAATSNKHAWGQRVVTATYHPAAAGYAGGEESEPGKYIVADLSAAKRAWETLQPR